MNDHELFRAAKVKRRQKPDAVVLNCHKDASSVVRLVDTSSVVKVGV